MIHDVGGPSAIVSLFSGNGGARQQAHGWICMSAEDTMIQDFKDRMKKQGFEGLKNEIILRELCAGCGACSAVCPRDIVEYGPDGLPRLKGGAECVPCGLCAIHCPRSFLDTEEVERSLFRGEKDELGYHIRILSARAKDPELQGSVQDGGVVSAILKHAFGDKSIDGAVVCLGDERFIGSPFLAKNWEDAKRASKSKYNLSPNLVALRQARQERLERLALVGLPCHLAAFRKLEFYGPKSVTQRVAFTVGIFCSENFCERLMAEFLPARGIDPLKITKLNIKGLFRVEAGGQLHEIPLPQMNSVVNPGCLPCRDFTAEFADISVGAVGSPDGWCTVIARTPTGDAILKSLLDEGALETGELTKPKTLRRMSLSKKKRGNLKLIEIMSREAALPFRSVELPAEEKGEEK